MIYNFCFKILFYLYRCQREVRIKFQSLDVSFCLYNAYLTIQSLLNRNGCNNNLCLVQKKSLLVREKSLYFINKQAGRKNEGRLLCTPLSSRTHPGARSLQWGPCRQKHSVFGFPLRSYELLSIPNKGDHY